jgi:hypothetical protein
MDKQQASKLSHFRKYIHSDSEAVLVKQMIADGLPREHILEALGYAGEASREFHPDAHPFSDMPTEQEASAQEAAEPQAGESPQPGVPEGDAVSSTEDVGSDSQEEEDPLVHVAGLLNHIVGKKAKKSPK